MVTFQIGTANGFTTLETAAINSSSGLKSLWNPKSKRQSVLSELTKVHAPGEHTELGFRVLGYAGLGTEVSYLAFDA